MSDGETPDILEACPMFSGLRSDSFCRASMLIEPNF